MPNEAEKSDQVPGPEARPTSQAQKILAEAYGGGDFAYLAEAESSEAFVEGATGVGDTLFTFLAKELGEAEGCEDLQDALNRVEAAQRDLQAVRDAIGAAIDAEPAPV